MSDVIAWNERGAGFFPGHVGLEITGVESGEITARLSVQPHHLAPNGFLHAGSVITLADTCCGYGTFNDLPQGATGFTTIELKTSFLGTALAGDITCIARRVHEGRTTQVWDAEVASDESGKTIALFRCTQMVLYPRG
jgi:1,4-dihydroxy-2-naphthoyl-CoA hydrolase